CTSPATFSGLAEGSHSFEVRASNPLGSTGGVATHDWTVDTTAPGVSITSAPPAQSIEGEATFEFASDDEDATAECRIDPVEDAAWEACESPAAYTGLADGDHRFEVRAVDPAGNRSQPAVHEWSVDATAPTVTITDAPPAASASATATINFTTDDPAATIECRLGPDDSEPWTSCASPFEVNGLADGPQTFQVRATDEQSNVGAAATHTWTVDTVAPVVTIDTAPASPSGSIHAVFGFSASEDIALAECRLDPEEGAAWETCESPAGYTDLADGDHRFEVRVSDAAGNASEPVVHEWTVETVKPEVSITSAPPSPVNSTTATFEFSSDNSAATFQCRLDAGDETPWETCESPAGFSGLADGSHRFEVRAVDAEAGTGPAIEHEWTIDTAAPSVTITGSPAPISGSTDPSFGFIADEAGTTAECRLDPADDEAAWQSCLSPVVYTGLAEGEHRFEVRVTDAVGLISETATYEWIVETTPPTATITSGPSGGVTTEISAWFGFSSDNPLAGFECRIDPSGPGGWTPCVSGVEYDNLPDGERRFEVRAVGQGAGPGPVVFRTWTIDTVAPAVSITSAPAQPTNERTASFTVEVNKPGFTLECQIDAEPAGPCTSPVVYADLEPGDHSFVVEALDSEGEVVDSAVSQWTILAQLPAVSITNGPPALSSSGTAVFTFTSDVAEATFECRIDGGAWTSCTSPSGYSGLSGGDHGFEVRAALAGSSAGEAALREWSVDTVAPAVSVTGGPAGTVASSAATFTIGTDEAGATTECSLDGGDWVTCEGEVSFDGLADGSHTLRVRAVDAVGNTGLARRDWSVDRTPPTTGFGATPAAETSSFDARFTFRANEPASTFECRLDGGEWKPCSSAHQLRGLARGGHNFAVRASDSLGNRGPVVRHRWRIVAPQPKGLVPKVAFKRRARLDADGTTKLATVSCPEGRCRVIAPKRVTVRVKGRKFTAGVKSPRGWYRERSSEVMLVASKRARKTVRKLGAGKVRLKLTVESDNGKRRSAKTAVTLVVGR
ncbi:MAG: hypothetical protein M3Y23_00350, partial [Actinomycetota bacterium]|nr:hypothetical protein [Actinomycetota bacterium]